MLNAFAPPFRLVALYFLCGLFYLVLSSFVFLYAKNSDILDFNFVAFVHTFLLGFVINIIIGALYQLTSVILEKPFFSIKGAFLNCVLQNISIAFLIYAFISGDILIMFYAGLFVVFCLIYFDGLFLLTFLRDFKIKFASICFMIGGIFLAISMVFAVFLLMFFSGFFDIDYNLFLKIHIYFALGFMFCISIGAASVLVPMFTLAHKTKHIFSKISLALYILAFVFLIFNSFYACLIILSLVCFALDNIILVYKRVRKARDYYVLNLYFSIFGAFLCLFYTINKDLYNLILMLFFGILMPFIIAHIYKILPFLIWYHYVSKLVGKQKVPLLNDMVLKSPAYISLILNISACFFVAVSNYFLSFVCIVFLCIFLGVNINNFFKYTKV